MATSWLIIEPGGAAFRYLNRSRVPNGASREVWSNTMECPVVLSEMVSVSVASRASTAEGPATASAPIISAAATAIAARPFLSLFDMDRQLHLRVDGAADQIGR